MNSCVILWIKKHVQRPKNLLLGDCVGKHVVKTPCFAMNSDSKTCNTCVLSSVVSKCCSKHAKVLGSMRLPGPKSFGEDIQEPIKQRSKQTNKQYTKTSI